MTTAQITLLVIAVCLVPLAGLFGAMDAALQRVSKARVEEMRREGTARAAGHSMGDELLLLAARGVAHLLGYDRMRPEEEKEMFGLQQRLLEGWRSTPRDPVTGQPAGPAPGTEEPGPR